MNRDKVKQNTVLHEGCIEHMYLDTRGNVTIGVGQLVPSVNFAKTLEWVVRETGEPATIPQIVDDYESVTSQTVGMIAARYKACTRLDITPEEVDKLLDKRVDEFTHGLQTALNDFGQFPDPAQEALLDMAFNLGVSGLVRKFPTLMRAAKQQDWRTCAAECDRRGIGDKRNQATRELFDAAETT